MWPFRKKLGQRRLEVRRSIPRQRAPFWRRFREVGGLTGLCLGLVLLAGAAVLDVWPVDPMPYRIGQYLPADIHSRAKFRFLVGERVKDEQERAAEISPARFRLDPARVDLIAGELKKLPDRLKAATRPANVDKDLRAKLGLTEADAAEVLTAWRIYATAEGRARLDSQIDRLQEALRETYIVDPRESDVQFERLGVKSVVLLDGSDQIPVLLNELITTEDQKRIDQAADDLAQAFEVSVRRSARSYLSQLLRRRHIYALDKAATQEARQQAADRIGANPPEQCYDVFLAGDRLVRGGLGSVGEEPARSPGGGGPQSCRPRCRAGGADEPDLDLRQRIQAARSDQSVACAGGGVHDPADARRRQSPRLTVGAQPVRLCIPGVDGDGDSHDRLRSAVCLGAGGSHGRPGGPPASCRVRPVRRPDHRRGCRRLSAR